MTPWRFMALSAAVAAATFSAAVGFGRRSENTAYAAIFEQARGLAISVPPDLAADRVGRARGDLGECERARVGEHRVPERRDER